MARTYPISNPRLERDRDRDRRDTRDSQLLVERDDLVQLLASEQGRRVAARILREAMTRQSVFNQNAMVMSANAGKQELGLWLARELRDADLTNYLRMQSENDDA